MQPLIRPWDWNVAVDVRHVAEAGRVLQVREAEIFQLAYRFWYQRELRDDVLDETFADYLRNETVPSWVRDYCRRVLNLAAVGQLHPRDFGVERPDVNRAATVGRLYTALLTALAFFVYLFFVA